MLKIELRKQKKQAFRQWAGPKDHPTDVYVTAESNLNSHLNKHLKTKSGVAAAYRCLWGEPNLQVVVKEASHLNWVFPKIEGESMSFLSPQLGEESFQQGPWDLMEPSLETSDPVPLSEIDLFLVPGVAFDHCGHRLGRGKGFYDKALEGLEVEKIGVAFDVQVSKQEIAHESHDVKMNFIATESGVVEVN